MNRKGQKVSAAFWVLCAIFAMVSGLAVFQLEIFTPAYAGDDVTTASPYDEYGQIHSAPFTDETFVRYTGWTIDGIKKWGPCNRAWQEYLLRLREWTSLLARFLEKKEMSFDDIKEIDFSLPDDPEFGHRPDKEFFNRFGRFKAFPIPQAVLDELTTVKNSRLIFNMRKWHSGELPIDMPKKNWLSLVVILPNVKPECRPVWQPMYFSKWDPNMAPDNSVIINDKLGVGELRQSSVDDKLYLYKKLISQ